MLTTAAYGTRGIWNLRNGMEVGGSEIPIAFELAFSADSSKLIQFGKGVVKYWQTATGKPDGEPVPMELPQRDFTIKIPSILAPISPVRARLSLRVCGVAFSPDRSAAAVLCGGPDFASAGPTAIQLWDLNTRKKIAEHTFEMKTAGLVVNFSFTPDGQSILLEKNAVESKSGQKNELFIWWRDRLQPVHFPQLDIKTIERFEFSPDGKLVIAVPDAHFDAKSIFEKKSFRLTFLDPATWQLLGESEPIQGFLLPYPAGVQFLPDGKKFLLDHLDIKGGNSVFARQVWDAEQRKPITAPFGCAPGEWIGAFSNDGRFQWSGRLKEFRILEFAWREVVTGSQIGPSSPYQVIQPIPTSFWSRMSTTPKLALGLDSAGSLWRIAEPAGLRGDPECVRLWVEVITGFELNDAGEVQQLSAATWHERKQRLAELGGPPVP
jgi:WD40 repeat protein